MRPQVLIVEDDTLQAMQLESHVIASGCDVVGPTGYLAEALHLVETTPIDFAFLDVRLHEEESFGVAAALNHRRIPFIFLTAFDRKVPRGAGFRELSLQKPMTRVVVDKLIKLFNSEIVICPPSLRLPATKGPKH